jgi:type IV secretion system protein VirB10
MSDPIGPPGDGLTTAPASDNETFTAERSISPVASRFAQARSGKVIGLAALIIGCGVVYAATWRSDRPKPDKIHVQPARQIVPYEPAPALAPPGPTLANPGPNPPTLTSEAGGPFVPPISPDVAVQTGPSGSSAPEPGPVQADRQAQARADALRARAAQIQTIRAAPILAYSHGGGAPSAPQGQTSAQAVREMGGGASNELDDLRRASALGRASARSVGDRNFLILAGSAIPCVLQTAMDTATPGYVSCIIPIDIYSDNGAVILLEKGSKVLGEYRSGMRQGQRRLFVLWTRAVTPAGVAIVLASPAADALGRAGFDGVVDSHFWERFGGALLLSIVDDGAYAAVGRNDDGQTARLPSDASAVALQNSINIPPSLRKLQGSEVSILAAQDFDFSAVYGLRSR